MERTPKRTSSGKTNPHPIPNPPPANVGSLILARQRPDFCTVLTSLLFSSHASHIHVRIPQPQVFSPFSLSFFSSPTSWFGTDPAPKDVEELELEPQRRVCIHIIPEPPSLPPTHPLLKHPHPRLHPVHSELDYPVLPVPDFTCARAEEPRIVRVLTIPVDGEWDMCRYEWVCGWEFLIVAVAAAASVAEELVGVVVVVWRASMEDCKYDYEERMVEEEKDEQRAPNTPYSPHKCMSLGRVIVRSTKPVWRMEGRGEEDG
ncbi:hypothetical protein Hypma_004918 [Hypsizygus marmoreus]|uniref:Uncharacterized protein n=1 Tax=Hypsizygus marmoreus TaxID=39966 RepID=A0A369KBT2_HYPMA|nr:hypothetical protein Hypma_004918 [Hypsizygus marmoreus]